MHTQQNNYITSSRARVTANKNTGLEEFETLLRRAKDRLDASDSKSLIANLNGILVELITNSEHQVEFWSRNWWLTGEPVLPHVTLYSVTGVVGLEPSAYYCPDLNSALFLNTEYYGQCKSWALGIAASIMEKRFNTLSIHGATALYKDKGVVIIAPTGTGKTTQSFKIFLNEQGKICGDDWAYVSFPDRLPESPDQLLVAKQPERALYMRSETQKEQPWLRDVFDRSVTENVVTAKDACEYPMGRSCAPSRRGVASSTTGCNAVTTRLAIQGLWSRERIF